MMMAGGILLLLLASMAGAQVPSLPEGPGKTAVVKLCSDCHGVAILMAPRRTKDAWQKSVEQMAALGVQGTDEEFEAVVDYLARHFGKINVNRASVGELEGVLEISRKEAEAIVRHREANGEFQSIDGLKKASGVDAKKLDGRRDRILFR